jgi:ubiquinone/menaquinone biosynthesis C-methylase UbiE
MRLNRFEFYLMNNPVRAAVQRHFEARRLFALGGEKRAEGRALEVGCGRGVGATLVLDRFGADRVEAFDLDPKMVRLAARRLHHRPVNLWVGDVTRIPVADETYDTVFDFGILHHVPRWTEGLKEIFRVLKPGGRFYAEEILEFFIVHPVFSRFFDHPMENRFDHARFKSALKETGFSVIADRTLWRFAGFYVAVCPTG